MSDATAKMEPEAAALTAYARWLTIISWCTYPGVYIVKMVGLSGVTATAAEQIGYSGASDSDAECHTETPKDQGFQKFLKPDGPWNFPIEISIGFSAGVSRSFWTLENELDYSVLN